MLIHTVFESAPDPSAIGSSPRHKPTGLPPGAAKVALKLTMPQSLITKKIEGTEQLVGRL